MTTHGPKHKEVPCAKCKQPFLRFGTALKLCPDCAEEMIPPTEAMAVDDFMASRLRSRLGLRHLDTLDFEAQL